MSFLAASRRPVQSGVCAASWAMWGQTHTLIAHQPAHSPSHLQTDEDLPVSAQGAQAPATLCASQTADVVALGITPRWLALSIGRQGGGDCFEGRAGRPVPAMTLSDVPHKPRTRAFAPPGHGLAVFPRSLALACSAVLRPRVPLSRYFVAAAHQSNPAPALGRDGGYCVAWAIGSPSCDENQRLAR